MEIMKILIAVFHFFEQFEGVRKGSSRYSFSKFDIES